MSTNLLNSSSLTFAKGAKQPPPPTRVSDNLRSEDQIEVLLGLGEGPWSKLHDGMKSFYIANTPLMASDGTLNFPDAKLFFHKGTQFPDPVKLLLGGSASGHSVSVNLAQNVPVTRTTTRGDIDAIDVRLRIDQLVRSTESGDKLNLDLLFKVEVKPTSSATWTSLPPNTGYLVDNEQPLLDNTTKKGFSSILQKIENFTIEEQLTQYEAEVAAWEDYKQNVDGPIDEALGVETYAKNLRVYGVTTSPVMKEIRIPVTPLVNDTYDIRVTKLSAETTDLNVRELTWDTFEQITSGDKSYPNTVMMQGIFKASDQLSSVPQMYGIYDTTEVLVPTIFDPLTLSYDFSNGPWDGSFKTAFTSDLAWIIYDLIHNDVHGIAAYHPINFSKYEALEASIYWNACDPVTGQYVGVPVTGGGTRPRVSFHGLIDSPRNSMELLTYMAGAGNAVFYEDASGIFRLKVEQDTLATKTFNNMDVVEGKFNYSFTDINSRYNDITVVYRNKKLPAYQEDRRRVFSQEDINLHGRKPLTFVAIGCVDTDEALSRAYHKLITSLTETRNVSFKTTRFGAYVEPHDIILISDRDMEEGTSRRSLGFTNTTRTRVFINEPFALEAGVTDYIARLQTVNGIVELAVLTTGVTADGKGHISFGSEVPLGLPENFSFSIASATSGDVKPYRVIGIEKADDSEEITISAIEVNRAKYDLIDNYDGSEFDLTEEDDFVIPSNSVQDFEALVTERQTDTGKVKDVELTWSAPQASVAGSVYVINYNLNDGLEQEIYRGAYLNFNHSNIAVGKHTYTIAATKADGKLSPETRRLKLSTEAPDYGLPQISTVDIVNQKQGSNTYIGSSVAIKWNPEPTEAWEGWDVGKPHPNFDHFRIQFNGQGTEPAYVEEVTDWNTRTLTISKASVEAMSTLGDIRDYSVTVSVVDADGGNGVAYTRTITKPPYSVSGVTPYHPETVSTQGRLRFANPNDVDFVGLKVWLSDTPDAANTGTLQWEGAGEPFIAMQDGTNYIAYQTIDVFGTVGMPISEIQYTATVTPTADLVADIEEDIEDLQGDVDSAIIDIADLTEVYGDTVSATASADAAEVSEQLAAAARAASENAQSAAEEAQNHAELAQFEAAQSAAASLSSSAAAASSRNAASNHADNADAARLLAEQAEADATTAKNASVSAQGAAESAQTSAALSATDASGSASSAATSESNAATSENNAGQSASAASSSASLASTKADEAGVSASSAASEAITASTAAEATEAVAIASLPSTMENSGAYFFAGLSGNPLTVADAANKFSWEASSDPVEGPSMQNSDNTGGDWLTTKGTLPYIVGDTYRLTVRLRENVTPTNDHTRIMIVRLGADYIYDGADLLYPTLTEGVTKTESFEWTATQLNYDQGARFIRATAGANVQSSGSNDGQWEYFLMKLENVTPEVNARTQALASAASASQASASETAAGQAALSSSGSAVAASTSAGQASSSAGNAASSETNALGSANSAATSASNAANSETASGNSASAAATSASNASSSASEAAQSAAASQTSRLAAETAESNASASETAAAVSETNASGSAGSASTSAAQSSASETAAGNSAGAASTSANNASTSASNADVSAGSASTSANNASNSETAAGNSASAASTSASNAASSASDAAQQASASDTARLAAETARSGAESSETAAALSATNADSSASQASTSATNAANSETSAGNSASAAATDASTATTKASEAAQSATTATASEAAAQTSAGNALASETAAATSETNAQGSANAAGTSATNAANSESAAGNSASAAANSASTAASQATNAGSSATAAETSKLSAVAATRLSIPSTFEDPDPYFSYGLYGAPDTMADVTAISNVEAIDDAVEGKGIRIDGGRYITTKATLPVIEGHVYKLTARFRASTLPTKGFVRLGFRGLEGDYTYQGRVEEAHPHTDFTDVTELKEYSLEWEASANNVANGMRHLRPEVYFNSHAGDGIFDLFLMDFKDVTAETNAIEAAGSAEAARDLAAIEANAAVTSAAQALASETAAGQSASVSELSRLASGTSATNAAASETAAANSATTAQGSASQASSSAGLATAAAGTASSAASDAQTHANSAASSATTANNAASAASTSEGIATAAENAAAGSASAAQTAETNAAVSATDAGTFASAASSAKTAAESAQSAASVSESNATTAASDANGYAASAVSARDQVVSLYDSETGRVAAVEASVSSQASTIVSNTDAAAALRTDVDANTASVSTQAAAISDVEGDIASLTTSVGTANSNASIALNAAQTVEGALSSSIALRANGAQLELFSMDDPSGPVTTIRATADNIIADGTIKGKHIEADSITADKINVTNLNAVSATLGEFKSATTGARMEIKDDRIIVYDASNTVRVKIGNLS